MSNNDGEKDITSVQVKADTWSVLNRMKRPGDSMDDVIQRLLSDESGSDGGNQTARASS